MKRIVALLLTFVLMFSFAACGSKKEGSGQTVLKIGMECNYAPYNWTQPDDSNGAVPIKNVSGMYANGYDVQVALKIAESLGMTPEIYAYEWDSLVPAVESGTLDLIIAGMSPTDERKEKIDFSDIYYTSNLVIVTKKGALEGVTNISGLAGKKIAAQSGTSHLDALSSQTTATVSELADFSVMLLALKAGTIEGYVAEEPTAMAVCTESSDYTYIPLVNNETGFTVPVEDTSIAVGIKKNSELLAKINAYIATFPADAQKSLMQQMVDIAPTD